MSTLYLVYECFYKATNVVGGTVTVRSITSSYKILDFLILTQCIRAAISN